MRDDRRRAANYENDRGDVNDDHEKATGGGADCDVCGEPATDGQVTEEGVRCPDHLPPRR